MAVKKSGKRGRSPSSSGRSASRKKSSNPAPFFPIRQIHEFMQQKMYGKEVKPQAAIFLAGIIEYVAAELIELSINVSNSQASGSGAPKVTATHVETAIQSDRELKQLMDTVRGTEEQK